MSVERELLKRSHKTCEICSSQEYLLVHVVSPKNGNSVNEIVHMCTSCDAQIKSKEYDVNHWRCLNDAMWSEVDAVKVISYRVLHDLKEQDWARDLIDMFYMEEDVAVWAKLGIPEEGLIVHKDANGAVLEAGDSVVLIKDLKVKGGGFTAKRGTAVRNITLDMDNQKYIEGKVDGQRIVLITDYVKK